MFYEIKLKDIEKIKTIIILAQFDLRDMNKLNQRKATLKLSSDGELSSLDMTTILELLANKELTQFVLACDPQKNLKRYYFILKTTDK